MSDFVPASFRDLLQQLYGEARAQDSVFGLPRRKWYLPASNGVDLSVRFHNLIAGNPSGPAAGPHTQLAQNLLLSYVAGGRMLEFKTVQSADELNIPRPCIDMATVGFNVEWSQELKIEQSIQQYVIGMMLIEVFRNDPCFAGDAFRGRAGEVVFDMSVGYSLEGIQSERLSRFFDAMRDAAATVEALRQTIPSEYALARRLSYPSRVSSTVTLSTFHGCRADEIEKTCEYLIAERDLNVIVKMNPPMLGREMVEHLLHDVMGYRHILVSPAAYETGLDFDHAVQMVDRLTRFAAKHGRCFGCKFSNTLEVINDGRVFGAQSRTQYLSGAPLHVITMTLTDRFREAVGAQVPISFSAGIDSRNFADAVACGFVPVTACTDLLRPGGYGRLPAYLDALSHAMRDEGAATIDEFIVKRAKGPADLHRAMLANTHAAAEKARNDPRYRSAANSRPPKRVESKLETFDCLNCDKCIPACPNAANFIYHTTPVVFDILDCIVQPDGTWSLDRQSRRFEVQEPCQIANFADFCNACGNCDTFCPEYGAPFVRKPQFYGSIETWSRRSQDGFAVSLDADRKQIVARIQGREHRLVDCGTHYEYTDDTACVVCGATGLHIVSLNLRRPVSQPHRIDSGVIATMRILLAGMADRSHITPVNARWLAAPGNPRESLSP